MALNWSEYEGFSGTKDVPLLLSERSQQMILSVMRTLDLRENWTDDIDNSDVSASDWNQIEKAIAEAYFEISEVQELAVQGTYSGETIWRSTNQTITPTSTWMSISFDSGISFIEGYWQLSPNPTRLTVPSDGIYMFGGSFVWQANSSGDTFRRVGRILKNGTTVMCLDTGSIVSQNIAMNMSKRVFMGAGDYIELQAFSDVPNLQVVSQVENSPLLWIERLR